MPETTTGRTWSPRPRGTREMRVGEAIKARMKYLDLTDGDIKGQLRPVNMESDLTYGTFRTYYNGVKLPHTASTDEKVEGLMLWEHGTVRALRMNKVTIEEAAQQGDGKAQADAKPQPQPQPKTVTFGPEASAQLARERELLVDKTAFAVAQALNACKDGDRELAIQRARHYLAIASGLVGK